MTAAGARRPFPSRYRCPAVDCAAAAVLLALSAANIAADPALRGWAGAVSAVTALSLSVGVALRRRVPERTLLLALAVCLAQIVWSDGLVTVAFAVYAIVSAAADLGDVWAMRLALFGGLAAAVLTAVREGSGVGPALELALALAVPVTLSWAIGYRARCRRRYRAQLAERADALARLRHERERAAVAAQRVEICREMYDLAGHRVAGMVVHAQAAGRVLEAAPGAARRSLELIGTLGRASEAELRQVRALLREGD
ncbi:DUF7134 domain-containing protein [Streptomyces marincola]|uniref:histidine kinase n=1 Tax=Streptomyces marincola TaxID=2878388 RepID=A0A1W7CS85_9ACTN|nr:histidine kinase dimerization/phosphoacceptor domain-containing protein [Streptomyces marincola]ARQ67673.1 hypothetical protein CAG99_01470 [Streptomyces marincola]